MSKNTDIRRIDRDVQTYQVPLPEGGILILEYAKHKPNYGICETLSMKFPGNVLEERLEQVCRIDGSGIHTTPSIEKRYNELPKQVRKVVIEKVSPEAKNLLRMI